MDEYKQLRDSLNRMPNLRQPEQNPAPQQLQQAAVVAPESHIHEAQQAAVLEQPHRDEPVHEDNHQDTQSRVTWDYQDKDIL